LFILALLPKPGFVKSTVGTKFCERLGMEINCKVYGEEPTVIVVTAKSETIKYGYSQKTADNNNGQCTDSFNYRETDSTVSKDSPNEFTLAQTKDNRCERFTVFTCRLPSGSEVDCNNYLTVTFKQYKVVRFLKAHKFIRSIRVTWYLYFVRKAKRVNHNNFNDILAEYVKSKKVFKSAEKSAKTYYYTNIQEKLRNSKNAKEFYNALNLYMNKNKSTNTKVIIPIEEFKEFFTNIFELQLDEVQPVV